MTITKWNCQICGKCRPDANISVLQKPFIVNGQIVGEANIKYCNDNIECYESAKNFDYMKPKKEPEKLHTYQQTAVDRCKKTLIGFMFWRKDNDKTN